MCTILKGSEFLKKLFGVFTFLSGCTVSIGPSQSGHQASSIQLEKPKIISRICWLNTHTNKPILLPRSRWRRARPWKDVSSLILILISHEVPFSYMEKSSFSNISRLGSGRSIVLNLLNKRKQQLMWDEFKSLARETSFQGYWVLTFSALLQIQNNASPWS